MNRHLIRPRRTPDPSHATSAALEALHVLESHVRPDFRKTVVFGVLALIALIAGHEIGGVHARSFDIRLASYGCALAIAVFGVAASRTAAREVQRFAVARGGAAAVTPLRVTVLLVGYLIAIVSICDLVGVDVGRLLVGGAVTGIVVGLAAQPVLSNLFAGLVLLFARPYVYGQHVRVLSGALNGPHEGYVISAGLLYTVLETEDGPLNIPNSSLLAAAVGPTSDKPKPDDPTTAPAAGNADGGDPNRDGAAMATVVAGAESGAENKPTQHADE